MKKTKTMKNKIIILWLFLWIYNCSLPLTIHAEEAERIPYPHRTFIYVVDCSGSMGKHQTDLERGKQIISDLLPSENTTIIAFNNRPYITEEKLAFTGETSILSAIRYTNEYINNLWQENPSEKITIILFSDMCSSVSADDGTTKLNKTTAASEQIELSELEADWKIHIDAGSLKFYSLSRIAEEYEKEDDEFSMEFNPQSSDGIEKNYELSINKSSQDIIKSCVQAYSYVLTESNTAHWEESNGMFSEGTVSLTLNESYRTFLYFSDLTDGIPKSDTYKRWEIHYPDKYLLMLSNLSDNTDKFFEINEEAKIDCFIIPQPQLVFKASSDSPECFDALKFTIGISDGQNYLGYDTSNSFCSLEAIPPGQPQTTLTLVYDDASKCYETTYIPAYKGEHKITGFYLLRGTEEIKRTIEKNIDVSPYSIKLKGQLLDNYRYMADDLRNLYDTDSPYEINLSDYYMTQFRRIEFIVEQPTAPEIADWNTCSDNIGKIVIKPNGMGSTILKYTINYYDPETNLLDHSQNLSLKIYVMHQDKTIPLLYILIIALITLFATGCIFLYIKHHQHQ